MLALKAYYDGKTIVPFQKYTFKPRQQVLIVVDENETTQKNDDFEEKKYSASLCAFRKKYDDFLCNADSDLDSVFDNVRDKSEILRGTEAEEW